MLQQGCPQIGALCRVPQTFRNESDDHSGQSVPWLFVMIIIDNFHFD